MSNGSTTTFHEGPLIRRREAAAQGLKYYFTGKPCRRMHIAQRYTSGFQCVVCSSLIAERWHTDNPEQAILKSRRYRERNPQQRAASTKKWRDSHPEVVRATSKEWLDSNPDKRAAYAARQRVNAVLRQEKRIGRSKPESCEACGDREISTDKGSRIVFDHHHATGQARGWICHNCNIALGHANDSVGRLLLLVGYFGREAVPPEGIKPVVTSLRERHPITE